MTTPTTTYISELTIKVTRAGWFNFEGFGRPFEGWYHVKYGGWRTAGRAFTRSGADRKAIKHADLIYGGIFNAGCGKALRDEDCTSTPCCKSERRVGE